MWLRRRFRGITMAAFQLIGIDVLNLLVNGLNRARCRGHRTNG